MALLLAQPSSATDFFIATNGNDTNPGTRSKPFATLERAREAVRKLNPQAAPKSPITIHLRGGDYFRTNALELTALDSGTRQTLIIWQAAKGETVRLLGGRKLPAFQPVTDPALLARLDEKARSHVLQLDLHALGITDFGEMKSRGFARATAPAHCEVFFGG
jgi:hypothetical protein